MRSTAANKRNEQRESRSPIRSLLAAADRAFGYFCTLPNVLVVFLVVGLPTVYVIYSSFFNRDLLRQRFGFVGLDHYVTAFSRPSFWSSLLTTGIYVVGSVGIGIVISFIIALILNNLKGSRWIYFPIILLPWMIPKVATAIMWKWMLHDIYGIFNIILVNLHIIDNPVHWLGDPVTAMISLILADVWYRAPFTILLLYAGMQRIPDEIRDASVIDGANSWHFFRYIIVPYIKPELLISLVVTTMFVFREFGLPFVLTNGGPGNATEVLALTIYRQGNLLLRQGYASALSVIMLAITIVLVVIYFRTLSTDD